MISQVFIDADKGNYLNYFLKVFDCGLLAKDGFIVVDNVAYKGSPWVPNACYSSGPILDAFNVSVRYDRKQQ